MQGLPPGPPGLDVLLYPEGFSVHLKAGARKPGPWVSIPVRAHHDEVLIDKIAVPLSGARVECRGRRVWVRNGSRQASVQPLEPEHATWLTAALELAVEQADQRVREGQPPATPDGVTLDLDHHGWSMQVPVDYARDASVAAIQAGTLLAVSSVFAPICLASGGFPNDAMLAWPVSFIAIVAFFVLVATRVLPMQAVATLKAHNDRLLLDDDDVGLRHLDIEGVRDVVLRDTVDNWEASLRPATEAEAAWIRSMLRHQQRKLRQQLPADAQVAEQEAARRELAGVRARDQEPGS